MKRGKPLQRSTPPTARTGLTSRSELARGPGPTRSAPLPRSRQPAEPRPTPQRAAQGDVGGIPTPTRQGVYERDGHRCVCCGRPVRRGWRQLQHRRPRGMGGRKDHACPCSLLTVCGALSTDPDSCHERMESNRDEAREYGWLVPAGNDPATWPVRYHDGLYLLDHDGDRYRVA